MVAQHEGEESARLADQWFEAQPENLTVFRDPDGQPTGFVLMLAMQEADPSDIEGDPAVKAAWRYVLERAAWSEALSLPVHTDFYVYAQAIPRFVRAVGAAKLGKPNLAEEEIAQLQALSKAAENSYWSEQVHALVLAASGWQARGRAE
jgi:hypothetical protein